MSMFNIALSGLNAAKQALTTTSHNIANANNPDYNRQEVVIASVEGVSSSSGSVGRGVSVQNVRRLDNEFLSERLQQLASQLGFSETRANQLNELDRISSNPETSLEGAMQAFFQAAQDLSVRPNDSTLKQTFLFAAEEIANRFNGLKANAATLSQQADLGITDSVRRINTLTSEIAELNLQISDSTQFQGKLRIEPNDLIDRRDGLLKQLGTEMEIQTVALPSGRININSKLGVPLVSEGTAYSLKVNPPTGAGTKAEIVRVSTELERDANGALTGRTLSTDIPVPQREFGTSRLGALLSFRDKDLVTYVKDLDNIATKLIERSDAIQRRASLGAMYSIDPNSKELITGRVDTASGNRIPFTASSIAINTPGQGNDLIQQMADLFTAAPRNEKSITQLYRDAITTVGNMAAAAKNDVTAKEIIRDQVEADRSSFSGVNLDEEAANLLRYQQAYSASGKVISISQDLFKELLDIAGR